MYHIFFIHSSVNTHLVCFHVLALAISAAASIGEHVSFQLMVFFRRVSGSGIAGSHDSPSFRFLRKLHTIIFLQDYYEIKGHILSEIEVIKYLLAKKLV